jgi:hypothetical protein
MLLKLFHEMERKGTLPHLFYKYRIAITSKPYIHTRKKLMIDQLL